MAAWHCHVAHYTKPAPLPSAYCWEALCSASPDHSQQRAGGGREGEEGSGCNVLCSPAAVHPTSPCRIMPLTTCPAPWPPTTSTQGGGAGREGWGGWLHMARGGEQHGGQCLTRGGNYSCHSASFPPLLGGSMGWSGGRWWLWGHIGPEGGMCLPFGYHMLHPWPGWAIGQSEPGGSSRNVALGSHGEGGHVAPTSLCMGQGRAAAVDCAQPLLCASLPLL